MTGTLSCSAWPTARASGDMAAHTGVAFAGYIAGAALGSRIGGRSRRGLWPAPVTATLAVELLALAGFTMGWELQGATMRHVGTTLSTTYLTGTLTGAVACLTSRKQPLRHTRLNVTVLVALAAGAACGALLAACQRRFLPCR